MRRRYARDLGRPRSCSTTRGLLAQSSVAAVPVARPRASSGSHETGGADHHGIDGERWEWPRRGSWRRVTFDRAPYFPSEEDPLPKASKFERRRKKARRKRNRRERAANVSTVPSETRVRTSFKAKARRGDEAILDFVFSSTAVPFIPDEPEPEAAAKRRHDAVETWEAGNHQTVGDA
jgi:hypothetical protein